VFGSLREQYSYELNVKRLSRASRDLAEFRKALEEYPDKARRLRPDMDEKLLPLKDMPHMRPIYKLGPKCRAMALEGNVPLHTVAELQHVIRAHRILYIRRDILKQIEDCLNPCAEAQRTVDDKRKKKPKRKPTGCIASSRNRTEQ
jgi:hypothetical protein